MERLLHKYVRMLARYNAWANGRLYEACAGLERSSFSEDYAPERHLVMKLLNARLAADKRWRARLQGYAADSTAASDDLYEQLEPLREAQLAEDLLLSEHVHALSEEDLLRPIRYADDAGAPHANAACELLTALLVEQIDTRARVSELLERAGIRPPDLAVVGFVREVYVGGEALSH